METYKTAATDWIRKQTSPSVDSFIDTLFISVYVPLFLSVFLMIVGVIGIITTYYAMNDEKSSVNRGLLVSNIIFNSLLIIVGLVIMFHRSLGFYVTISH